MDEIQGIDLLELLHILKDGVDGLFPERIWVRAEVASLQARGNGHCYLELSQSDGNGLVAKTRAVIWRSRYMALAAYFADATGSSLQSGISILARVQVNFSELYGLTLVIDEIEPAFTLGEAELRRRRTIEDLQKQGLFERQKKLEAPLLPYRLAVISAADAAGYGDFCRHLDNNEFGFVFEVNLFPAKMQGDEASESINDAIEAIQTAAEKYDAVLIMRGGGSVLDLSCFDDYDMCFAIANCDIPVYTAIGHDRDFHVADMVAYSYVKTPTALADLFIDAFAAEDERISGFSSRLSMAFLSKISAMESRVDILSQRILNADPRNILRRGYTLITDTSGRVLKSASGLKRGDTLKVYFADGTIDTEVK